jgi:uncharacterized YigZ family protein
MQSDEYLTIAGPSEGIYKEKGSKFLGFAYPVHSENQVKARLEEVKSRYHDARHHCYAYCLGPEMKNFRMNDDGEPSSTAGRPIFGQIQSFNLTDVLVVVVRYFGGTLLGTSGLIRSYKLAAEDALNHARIIKKTIKSLYQLEFDYTLMNEVMRLLHEFDIQPYEREFKESCTFRIGIRQTAEQQVAERFRSVKGIEFKRISNE